MGAGAEDDCISGLGIYSTGAKMFPINTSTALLSLGKKAFQIGLQQFTTGDFCPLY